jgi:hypothetical protein
MRSGTARMKSDTATTGPSVSRSTRVTYGTRGVWPACMRFHSSVLTASRRNSVHDVADHTSAATPQSWASSCCAFRAHCMPVPEASTCARGAAPTGSTAGAAAYR